MSVTSGIRLGRVLGIGGGSSYELVIWVSDASCDYMTVLMLAKVAMKEKRK